MSQQEDARSSSPAAAAAAGGEDGKSNTIDLKLLSPSSDVPASGLFFDNLPTTTTLGELRAKITAALPSHPPPARQRLIYFGRVLQRDDDTLAGVFGENNITSQRQHTLHLVLPLREGGTQTPSNAPSPIPGPRASIYPPSAIPRPSSVPPRGASPFRPGTPQTSAPLGNAPPPPARVSLGAQGSQPQSLRPQLSNPNLGSQQQAAPATAAAQQQGGLDIRSLIGSANIRANITANGQPINLPPEVVNQLLNQHFLRNGGLPDLLANAAAQQQTAHQGAEQTARGEGVAQERQTNTAGRQPSEQQLFRQFMASVHEASRQGTPANGGEQQRHDRGEGQEQRGRSQAPSTSATEAPDPPAEAPATTNGDRTHADPPTSAPPEAQANQQPQPAFQERSGVNPDGTRWTIRTSTVQHPHPHPHNHPHPPQMAGMPFPVPFPQGFPFPAAQNGMPIPMAAPLANLRPQAPYTGTPRSASPARSVSEGPRRIGTPAADLQHRLLHTNHEIHNLNSLLSLLANGTMANGQPAPPLSNEQMNQIRSYAESMNAHIEGFGGDLERLANAHPSVRMQAEFVGLTGLFQAVQGQGRVLRERIDGLAPVPSQTAQGQVPAQVDGAAASAAMPSPSLATPSTTSDTLSPSLITRETSPADATTTSGTAPQHPTTTAPSAPSTPELHLLSDPTNTQHYLLVGPNGLAQTGHLPLDVLYPLLATGLPHDRLLQDFETATREMTHALARADFRSALHAGVNLPLLPTRTTPSVPATGVRSAGQVPAPPVAPAPQAQAQAQAQPRQAGPNDELRDALAPVVRNLWLLVRLCIFGWFFFSSGRGYGRLLLLCALGGIVWAVNQGLLGQRVNGVVEGVRRHFTEVVEEARGLQREGEGVDVVVERARGQRRAAWEGLRQVERSVALAVASLWPGVGEAVVRNAERRRREAEAATEAERRRIEEEAEKKRVEEERAKDEVGAAVTAGEGSSSVQASEADGVIRVNKGKEKATEANDVD